MSHSPVQWRPRSKVAWGALISLGGLGVAALSQSRGLSFVFGLLSLLLLLLLAWRRLAGWRQQLLWRLRNRLLVVYVLIGVIPVVLLLLIGLIAAWTLYGRVAVYLVTDQLEGLQAELQDSTSDVVSALEIAAALESQLSPAIVQRILAAHQAAARERHPHAEIHLLVSNQPAPRVPDWLRGQRFTGVLMSEGAEVVSSRPVRLGDELATVVLFSPLDADVLPYLGRDVGRVRLALLGDEESGTRLANEPTFHLGTHAYPVLRLIEDTRSLPPPIGWWDLSLSFVASQPTSERNTGREGPPLVLVVESRISSIHRPLAQRLGEFSGVPFAIFTAVAVLFLLLEVAALRTGIKLTRSITGTVNELQVATEQIQAGTFSHRIRVRGRDQLSGLAHGFNSMASSLQEFIAASRENQRLQDELEIARQVQEQLFPHEIPQLETLELVGRCQPARVVSGDYYDYRLLGPGKVVLAIGDISGKGISAALLMATIQAAMRSQLTAARLASWEGRLSTAELVTRLNQQLYETTSSEKYASLFCAYYNEADRTLTYTNAGHLPPIVLQDGRVERLEVGGSVVGLFGDVHYEEACVTLAPGCVLVGFTDGLTEAENAYGEELSVERLLAVVRARAQKPPAVLAQSLLDEVRQWSAAEEQADDMTLLVARAR